jgi:hypothetical protein
MAGGFSERLCRAHGLRGQGFCPCQSQPVIDVNGSSDTSPITIDAEIGKSVELDASKSHDPDGQALHCSWFHYAEAGITGYNAAAVTLGGAATSQATVTATAACRPPWIAGMIPCRGDGIAHIILAVTDEGSPQLTSYRRIILHVHGAPAP